MGELPKIGGKVGQFADLRGLCKKEMGGAFEGGNDTSILTVYISAKTAYPY